MDITILEFPKWTVIDYEITAPGLSFHARKDTPRFSPRIEISSESTVVASILRESTFSRSFYEFSFPDGRKYSFASEGFWKPVYTCQGNGESYTLSTKDLNNLSISRNGQPVATATRPSSFWKPAPITLSMADGQEAGPDAKQELLLFLCMILTFRTIEQENADVVTTLIATG